MLYSNIYFYLIDNSISGHLLFLMKQLYAGVFRLCRQVAMTTLAAPAAVAGTCEGKVCTLLPCSQITLVICCVIHSTTNYDNKSAHSLLQIFLHGKNGIRASKEFVNKYFFTYHYIIIDISSIVTTGSIQTGVKSLYCH